MTRAFAEPADAASLSHRFAKHGERRLELDVWLAVAKLETERLARNPKFKAIATEVSDTLPGMHEILHNCAHHFGVNVMGKLPNEDDD